MRSLEDMVGGLRAGTHANLFNHIQSHCVKRRWRFKRKEVTDFQNMCFVFAALHPQIVAVHKSIFDALISWTFLIVSLKSMSSVLSENKIHILLSEPKETTGCPLSVLCVC